MLILRKNSPVLNTLKIFTLNIFILSSTGIGSYSAVLPPPYMVEPGTLMSISAPFISPSLIGMQVHPEEPLNLSFLLRQGDSALEDQQIQELSSKMIRYFLAGRDSLGLHLISFK